MTTNSIVTSVPLRNVSLAYQAPNFIAEQVFPVLQIDSPKAKITKYLASDWFRNEADVRGEGGQAKRGGHKTTEVSYSCEEYAFSSSVTDEVRRNAKLMNAQPLQPDMEAVELCKRKILMKQEEKVSSLITSSTWADGNASGKDIEGTWHADASTNTFRADIKIALETLANKGIVGGGNLEIRLLVDFLTFNQLEEISAIKDQIKYTSAESITPQMLANILKIDQVVVANVIHNTAKETVAGTEFTPSSFWQVNASKGFAFLYAYPKQLGLRITSAGLLVNQKFDMAEGGGYERISKWREDAHHQDIYEVAKIMDELQLCADAGYLWKDTIKT